MAKIYSWGVDRVNRNKSNILFPVACKDFILPKFWHNTLWFIYESWHPRSLWDSDPDKAIGPVNSPGQMYRNTLVKWLDAFPYTYLWQKLEFEMYQHYIVAIHIWSSRRTRGKVVKSANNDVKVHTRDMQCLQHFSAACLNLMLH